MTSVIVDNVVASGSSTNISENAVVLSPNQEITIEPSLLKRKFNNTTSSTSLEESENTSSKSQKLQQEVVAGGSVVVEATPSSREEITPNGDGDHSQVQTEQGNPIISEVVPAEAYDTGRRYPKRERKPTKFLQMVLDEEDEVQYYRYAEYNEKDYDSKFAETVFDDPTDFNEFLKEEQEQLDADVDKQREFEVQPTEDGENEDEDEDESEEASGSNEEDGSEYEEEGGSGSEYDEDGGAEGNDDDARSNGQTSDVEEEDEDLLDHYNKFAKDDLDEEEIFETWLEQLDDEIDTELLSKKQNKAIQQQYKYWIQIHPNLDQATDEQYATMQQSVRLAIAAAKKSKSKKNHNNENPNNQREDAEDEYAKE